MVRLAFLDTPWMQNFTSAGMPLTEWSTAFGCVVAYLAALFALKLYMTNREPLQVKWLFALHNLFLCVGSLTMLLGISQKILDWVRERKLFEEKIRNFFCFSFKFNFCYFVFVAKRNLFHKWQTRSFFELYCDSTGEMSSKGTLWFWIYVFYVSKYYEFLDTVFLVVKKVTITCFFFI